MKATVYLSYVMVILLIILAMLCFFIIPSSNDWLPGNRRFVMGFILAAYAIVRAYRLKKFIKTIENE